MSPTDNHDDDTHENKPKKVYPKEKYPRRDITHSDMDINDEEVKQNEENNFIIDAENQSNSSISYLYSILKRDNNGNPDKPDRHNKPKSVVFDLNDTLTIVPDNHCHHQENGKLLSTTSSSTIPCINGNKKDGREESSEESENEKEKKQE
uniref:FCP1 homology domain-containing protein n=1 Tax=Parastrongyloides trichosuri TaxID=131310 RepID=A0A0N5A3L8_PARTI